MKIVSYVAATTVIIAVYFSLSIAGNTGSCFAKGDNIVQAGIGLGLYGSAYGDLSFPPISANYEYGITDLISVGGGIGYQGSSYSYGYSGYEWKYSYSYIPIMARAAFHPFNLESLAKSIPMRDKWDVYGGISLGYAIVSASVTAPAGYSDEEVGYSAGASYFQAGLLLGTRWYFTPKFGVYAEEGSGFGWFNVGVALKF